MKGLGYRYGRPGPVFVFGLWGLAGAAVVALLLSSGRLAPWHGFLMAVPFMAARGVRLG